MATVHKWVRRRITSTNERDILRGLPSLLRRYVQTLEVMNAEYYRIELPARFLPDYSRLVISTERSYLFTLPGEIRNDIYERVFASLASHASVHEIICATSLLDVNNLAFREAGPFFVKYNEELYKRLCRLTEEDYRRHHRRTNNSWRLKYAGRKMTSAGREVRTGLKIEKLRESRKARQANKAQS